MAHGGKPAMLHGWHRVTLFISIRHIYCTLSIIIIMHYEADRLVLDSAIWHFGVPNPSCAKSNGKTVTAGRIRASGGEEQHAGNKGRDVHRKRAKNI